MRHQLRVSQTQPSEENHHCVLRRELVPQQVGLDVHDKLELVRPRVCIASQTVGEKAIWMRLARDVAFDGAALTFESIDGLVHDQDIARSEHRGKLKPQASSQLQNITSQVTVEVIKTILTRIPIRGIALQRKSAAKGSKKRADLEGLFNGFETPRNHVQSRIEDQFQEI